MGRLAALLAVLLSAMPAAAMDIGAILDARRLASFAAAPSEAILAASHPDQGMPALAIGRIGLRWGYLSLHATPAERVARFGPFPFGRCGDARPSLRIRAFGAEGWSAAFDGCQAEVDPVWLLLPGGTVLSMDPARPGRLTRWAGSAPEEDLLAMVRARWAAAPPLDARGGTIPPAAWQLVTPPAAAAPEDARAAALRLWRRRDAPDPARARAALAAFGATLDATDWFAAGSASVEVANDAAFFLQQSGGCREAADAVALLDAVLRADPGRVPARLNRADALAARGACANDRAATFDAAEEYRRYCEAHGPGRLPQPIARRIAAVLEVPRLDAEVCRPRLGAHRAVMAGDLTALAALLAVHPEDAMAVGPGAQYPLVHAIDRRDVAAARLLLDAGASPDRGSPEGSGYPPLTKAAWNGDVAMLRLLLAHRARADAIGALVAPLTAASMAGRAHGADTARMMVTLLLDAGAGVNAVDREGRTPLMEAVGAPAPPPVIALLLDRGAAVNRIDRYARNAAHAIPPFTPETDAVLAVLVAAGVNLHQQDAQGQTPLNRLFVWSGRRPEVVRSLALRMLAAGADPRVPDLEGRSALFRAAVAGDPVLTVAMVAAAPRGPYPAAEDPIPLVRRRMAQAGRDGCPCLADWQAVLAALGAD